VSPAPCFETSNTTAHVIVQLGNRCLTWDGRCFLLRSIVFC